jgi:hypothetical protein
MLIEIQDKDGLVRDMSSGAILNTNRADYENYLSRREQSKKAKQEMAQQAEEINSLKNELSEIKQMLFALINNRPER